MNPDQIEVLAAVVRTILYVQVFAWFVSVCMKDVSLVDRVWGLLFIAGGVSLALNVGLDSIPAQITMLIVLIWGLRLSIYLHLRNSGRPEDYRYQNMRAKNPRWFWLYSFVTVFLLQGLIALWIGMPIYAVLAGEGSAEVWIYSLGAGVAMFGVVYEAVADYQLSSFKRRVIRKDVLMDSGLWGLSRHPNYFGEILVWWGLWLIACSVDGGWKSLPSPILMTFLLVRVSGVSLLEKDLKVKKVGYDDYVASTPALIPNVFKALK